MRLLLNRRGVVRRTAVSLWQVPQVRVAGLLLLAFVVGYLQGSSQTMLTPYYYDPALSENRHSRGHRAPTVTARRNDTGWTSIDVFYGTVSHLDTQNRTWFSQARQDELVYRLLKHKRNGYFIELAANDAVDLSNSLGLERNADWTGLCIEPNPLYWKNLSYRKCQTVGAVVGSQRDEQVHFRYSANEYGGIIGFNNGHRWRRESTVQSTVTLHEIFQRHQVPREIDYLSLDVEGAESFILLALPLHEYRIKLITAERLKGEIRRFLKNHSYDFAEKLTRWGESLWVHKDYKRDMNWTCMNEFGFPLF